MMKIGAFILNLYFVATLLTSGLSKLASPDYSLLNAIGLRGKLGFLGQILYNILAWLEIGVSVLLVAGNRLALIANIVLFMLFLILQAIVLSFTKGINCGCFGNLYKIQNDKIHVLVTVTQLLLSYFYYRLATTYMETFQTQTLITIILFSALCVLILVRRLSLSISK